MGVYDQAQSQRIAQRTGVEQPGIRLVYLEELPEIAYKGQIIYNGTSDYLLVYDGEAWQTIGDNSGARLFVQSNQPSAPNQGDQWYSPTTGLLLVFNGSDWVEPEIPEDAVGEEQLEADAITSKHTIIAANFMTAEDGPRMLIANDTAGGVMRFFYGLGEALTGFINPKADGSRPQLQFSSGTIAPGGGNSAQMSLFGSYSDGNGKKAEFNCNVNVAGDIRMNGNLVSTSSRRYKEDIQDLPYDRDQILSLRPVEYTRKDTGVRNVGFIAEDAEELGLHRFVVKVDGQVEAFNYPAYTAALQQVCREQEADLVDLKARLDALEAK